MAQKQKARDQDSVVRDHGMTNRPYLAGLRRLIDDNHGITVLVILALGLVWRVIYFHEILHSPYGNDLPLDCLIHHDWAVKLAGGQWLHDDVFFRAPLYPYFLGLIYTLFNNSQEAAKLIQMLLGCFSCLLTYHIAKKVFNRKAALIALILSSFYGMFIYFENELLIVSLIIFLDLMGLLFLIRATESSKPRDWFLSGLFLGLSAIARPNILIFVGCVPFWIYFTFRRKAAFPRMCLYAVALAIGCIIPILPVTIHNYIVGKDIVLIASQGGLNFYIGNNPESDGRTAVLPGTRDTWWGGYEDQINAAKRGLNNPNAKPSEISHYWYAQGYSFILNNPTAFLRLMLKKLYFFWNAHEIGNNRGIQFVTRYSRIFTYFTFKFWLVCPLAFAGAYLALRQKLRVSLLLLFILSYTVSIIMFFVCARYRMPVIPLLIIFASYAVHEWLRNLLSDGHMKVLVRQPVLRISLGIFLVVGVMISPITVAKGNLTQGYFNEGEAYRMKHDFYNAIKCYEKAKNEDPGYVSPYINMANVYLDSLNDHKAAEGVLEEALQINPASEEVLYSMGIFCMRTQQNERAGEYFMRTLQRNDRHTEAHIRLGELYEMGEDFDKALAEYMQAVAIDPNSYVLYGRIGNAYIKLQQFPQAREAFEKALEIHPGFAGAHINIGETYLQEGNLQEAISHYRSALQIDPDDVMAYNNMGSAMMKMGNQDEALSYYDKAIDLKPDFYTALNNKADLLYSLERYGEAMDYYRRILGFYPKSTATWYRLAVVYEKLGMKDEAALCYSGLRELDPRFASPQKNNPKSVLNRAEATGQE